MSDAETYPPITRVYWHGDTAALQVAFDAYEAICDSVRDGRKWIEVRDENGCMVLVNLDGVQTIVQMTTEARVTMEERSRDQKLRFPE